MEKEYSDISHIMQRLQSGFCLRDLLIDMQNYYLEAADNGVLFISGEDSLADVDEMLIDLGGAFDGFAKSVRSAEIKVKAGVDVEQFVGRLKMASVVSGVEQQMIGESCYSLSVNFVS